MKLKGNEKEKEYKKRGNWKKKLKNKITNQEEVEANDEVKK